MSDQSKIEYLKNKCSRLEAEKENLENRISREKVEKLAETLKNMAASQLTEAENEGYRFAKNKVEQLLTGKD